MAQLSNVLTMSPLLVLYIFCFLAFSLRIRSQCWTSSAYYEAEKEHALVGHVFATYIVLDSMECGWKCLGHSNCLSFNYQHTAIPHHICELSDQVREARPGSQKPNPNFTYYEAISRTKVDSAWISSPCQNGGTCVETCDHRNYVCNCNIAFDGKQCQIATAKNCKEIKDRGDSLDGEYLINPDGRSNMAVYCDQNTDGGGWTVIQRRIDPYKTEFQRLWVEYEVGFGNLSGEFWLGNENIYRLTNSNPKELRIELKASGGQQGFSSYTQFSISSSKDNYRLSVAQYQGTAGNSLYGYAHIWHNQNNMPFSTSDKDNDNSGRCSFGWWMNHCGHANLNEPTRPVWNSWRYSPTITFSEMKIR